jgi:hypothetical protein
MFKMLFFKILKDKNIINVEFWICIENIIHDFLKVKRSIFLVWMNIF